MKKKELSSNLLIWLKKFLSDKFSSTHEVLEVFMPTSNLSKLPNKHIKSCENYSAWEFTPDILGILKNKTNGKIELVLMNRSVSALSLKEIGEIYIYSKLVNSKLSFLVSLNGVSSEVGLLLLEDEIRNRLLIYGNQNEIIVFSWDEKNKCINPNSIIPIGKRDFLLS